MEREIMRCHALNEKQCEEIAASCFRILEETGCVMHNQEARELLQKAGCTVEGELVKIPASLTQWAVEQAPSSVTIYNRGGKPAMVLEPGKVYFGPAISITAIEDLETGERRPARKQDSVDAAVLMDALENISWVSPCVSPSDAVAAVSDLEELCAVLSNTDKPVMYWAQNLKNLEYEFQMFEAVAGSAERLAERPFMVDLVCPIDPLSHTEDGLAQLMYLAKRKAPAVYIAGIGIGLTGPATIAGTVALGMADTMAGLVVSQVVNPGAPFIVSKFTDNVDMRTMSVTHSNPEMLLANIATADVFRYLGLPFCSNFAGTDSGLMDSVAAFDKGIQIYAGLLSGTNMNFALGAYESGAYAKLADLVVGNEMIGFLKIMTGNVEVSEETLAEDVIAEVGPGGVFFTEEHTLDHIYDLWEAKLMYPRSSAQATEKDKTGLEEAARQKVRNILAQGTVHPLPEEIWAKLNQILEKAIEEYENQ